MFPHEAILRASTEGLSIRKILIAAALASSAITAPALAVIPVYSSLGLEVPGNASFFAGNTSSLKTWFVGNGGAAFNVSLGAVVNGVDRGLGLNNQSSALGAFFDYGAVTAGDTISFYINVVSTGDIFSSDKTLNADGVQHLYSILGGYTGGDFGIPLDAAHPGSYFGFEDLYGGGDFNYTDLQFIARTGPLADVPEPASWALMIFGFGAVGGTMRRRAKVSVSYS